MAAPTAPFTEFRDADAILNFIFDPRKAFIAAGGSHLPSEGAPQLPAGKLAPPEHAGFTQREADAAKAADAGELDKALEMLEALCTEAPTRASAFNNRAQVKRLRGDGEGAKADLDTAIRLAKAWLETHGSDHALTGFHRTVLKQAFTQRSIYFHEKGDEAAAESDLHAAAAYGSAIARMMTTGSNPYAALCNNAISKMLQVQPECPGDM